MTLAGGRWIARHGLPHHDHLTIAGAGRRWIDEQWLAQWSMYELWRVGGYALVTVTAAALVAASFGLLAWILLERGSQPRRAVKWTVLAFAATVPDVAVRAQDFAYPLYALLLLLLLRKPTPRRMGAGLVLLVLWANLHGSVLIGSLLLAAACARRARHLPFAVAALAAPLATPYGLEIVHYYRSVLGNPALQRFASEWKPAWADPIAAVGFFALVLALGWVVVTAWRRGSRPQAELSAVTFVLVAAGFAELRWETWAAFPAVVLATDLLNEYDPRTASTSRRRWPAAVVALVAGAGVAVLATESAARFESTPPRGAMAAAARIPDARILADDTSSDALLWKYPHLTGRVAFDDRLEVYAPSAVATWADVILGKRPPSRSYDVFVASSRNDGFVRELRKLRVVYDRADGVAARTR